GASAGTFSSTTGLVLNATTGAIDLAASTLGTYTITNTVSSSGACGGTSATATVTINALPTRPSLTATYNGPTTTLTSSAATGNQFYFNGSLITGATGSSYVVNSAAQLGSYTVTTTNANGCTSLPSLPLVVTATARQLADASLQLYPNPTPDGKLTLTLSNAHAPVQLLVLNALGQVVYRATVPASANAQPLDLSALPSGVYLLRATTAEGTATRRFVRE
ncbi:T9SS type A sorting domain-containing protein, partial [Hymenobacter agri]